MKWYFNRQIGWACLLLCGGFPVALAAQEAPLKPGQKDEGKEPSKRSRANRDWWHRIGLMRAPGEHEKNHESVTDAFREILDKPSQATVRVYGNESQVALGAIVEADGYILTKASELKFKPVVHFANGDKLPARIVGVDPQTDLAMLKIEAKGLTVVEWTDEVPMVGGWLATTGFEPKNAAVGVVSVAPRRIGAPSAMLGVQLEEDAQGPRVNQVVPGSGAEKAGVRVNDIITHLNGDAVANREALVNKIRQQHSGDTVLLSVKRGGADLAIAATLSVITPGEPDKRRDFQNNLGGSLSSRRDGFPLALQHDTVLRPADCGGPLIDLDGKAVGINIARGGRVNSYAIPVSAIKPLLEDLKSGRLAPDVVAKRKLDALKASLAQLVVAEGELSKKTVQAEEAHKKAAEAEEAAKQAAEPNAAALAKLHSATYAAENALKQLRVDLTKARAELKRGEAERSVLEKSLPKE